MSETAIEVRGLTKSFGSVRAVRDARFTVPRGGIFGLLGVNGAGKTTLIRMLTGLLKPDAGDAFIEGHSVTEAKTRALVGLSPQETAVAPNLTARENLTMMAGLYGMDDPKKAAERCVERMGLGEYADRRARTLSGGWKRRLSIGMGIVSEPRALFLDEPTLGLDVLARRELWRVIEELRGEMTVVLTTHYMEEAESLCARIAVMAAGSVLTVGTLDELRQTAGCPADASLETVFVKLAGGGRE